MTRNDLTEDNKVGQASTYHPHECDSWQTLHYCNQKELNYQKCGYCGHIVRFRYKSFWRRLKSVFLKEAGEL